jgi:hypothetical protein
MYVCVCLDYRISNMFPVFEVTRVLRLLDFTVNRQIETDL